MTILCHSECMELIQTVVITEQTKDNGCSIQAYYVIGDIYHTSTSNGSGLYTGCGSVIKLITCTYHPHFDRIVTSSVYAFNSAANLKLKVHLLCGG